MENQTTTAEQQEQQEQQEGQAALEQTETPTIEEDNGAPTTESRDNFDSKLLARLWEQKTISGPDALRSGELVKRRKVTFVLDGAQCTPDFFVDDEGNYYNFRVTLRSLTSAEEAEALDGIASEGEVPFRLAKQCFYAINGTPVTEAQKNLLWEAFGMGGRVICFVVYQQIGSAGQAALGKSLASCTID